MRSIVLMLMMALVVPRVSVAVDPVAGTWRGDFQGGPAVLLHIANRDGRWTGDAVFYIMRHNDGGSQRTASAPVPLLRAKLDGKVFHFEVEVNSEPVPMQMELTSASEASFRNLNDSSFGPIRITRQP